MRKLIVLSAMLLTTLVAVAQHEEGDFTVQPKVGLNIANLSDADKPIYDLHFGLETEYMVSDNFSLGAGVILSNQGAKYDYSENSEKYDYTVDLDYVHIPMLATYYLLPGLAVKAGVQPGFKMRAKAKVDGRRVDLDEALKLNNLLSGDNAKINALDFSIPVGISYEYQNLVLDARYNWGLVKVVNEGDAFYNRVFMLSLGYKFQLGD